MIEAFSIAKSPLSSSELISKISGVDESTIFRNLKQFKEAGLLSEINLEEGFKRYELSPDDHHHHHIKCNICNRIDTIDLCELKAFSKQLKKIGYKNISHKFEFFGICKTCS
jgi:Fur family ferric uptake transcriptional regulator